MDKGIDSNQMKRILIGLSVGVIVWAGLIFLLLFCSLYDFSKPHWFADGASVLVAATVSGYIAKRSGLLCGAVIGAVQVLVVFWLIIEMARRSIVPSQDIFSGDFFIALLPRFTAIPPGAVGGYLGQGLARIRLRGTGLQLGAGLVVILLLTFGGIAGARSATGHLDFFFFVFLFAFGAWVASAILAGIVREMRTPDAQKRRRLLLGERPSLAKLASVLISIGTVGIVVGELDIRGVAPLAVVLWFAVSICFLIGGSVVLWISTHPTRNDSHSAGN